jgi:hypothetical protein
MEKKAKSNLAARREAFRLWFEYLRIARLSADIKIKSALVVTEPYYRPWEMDKADKFDPWWKTHGHLFEEKFAVRELKAGEAPLDPDALLVEVPLTQSPTILTSKVKAVIQAAFDARERTERKGKKKPTAYYRLTEGSEPKFDAVRVSMAETKCASWRGKIVPVWFREKGCMSPCELWRRAHRGVRRVA